MMKGCQFFPEHGPCRKCKHRFDEGPCQSCIHDETVACYYEEDEEDE